MIDQQYAYELGLHAAPEDDPPAELTAETEASYREGLHEAQERRVDAWRERQLEEGEPK